MALSKEEFEKISEYIYRKAGISLDERHFDKLNKYFDKRYTELNINSFRQYFFKIRFEDKDGEEFQKLMNAVTVNETYFYREKYQFEVLIKYVLPEIVSKRPKGEPIRILSAPCSSGEEAYTIALHLLDEGTMIEEHDFELIGIDINSEVIDKAKRGFYTERSVHEVPKTTLNANFTKQALGYQISADLRDAIDFKIANVFDKSQMRSLGKFDVIFSRNMLIYFDDASRKDVAMTFYDMLKPSGYIMLGHAEYMSRIVSVFHAKKFDNVLAYQK